MTSSGSVESSRPHGGQFGQPGQRTIVERYVLQAAWNRVVFVVPKEKVVS
jgi:hypothetical protein